VNPIRLLHVTQGYFPGIGGTERLIQRLSEELVSQFGDSVTVYTSNCYSVEGFSDTRFPRMPAGKESLNGVDIRRFEVKTRLSRALFWPQRIAYRLRLPYHEWLRTAFHGPIIPGLANAIRAHPADVVAASSFPLLHMFTSLGASHASGRPCVFYGGLHPEDQWGFDRSIIHAAIQAADRYVAYSPYEARFVCERGASTDRVRVLPLGVDIAPFETANRDRMRHELGLSGDEPLIGFIGQVGGHKGVHTLLEAMPLVWKEFPESRVLIAGARARFAETIDRQISAWPKQFQSKVIRRYDFDERAKAALFAAIDVLAYPSGYESFGLAFLEAWAAGRPVVSCRRGAIPDVVRAGVDGLLVPFQDAVRLAAALAALVRNPAWARALGAAGQRKVRSQLTWDRVAARFRDTLTEVIGGTGSNAARC